LCVVAASFNSSIINQERLNKRVAVRTDLTVRETSAQAANERTAQWSGASHSLANRGSVSRIPFPLCFRVAVQHSSVVRHPIRRRCRVDAYDRTAALLTARPLPSAADRSFFENRSKMNKDMIMNLKRSRSTKEQYGAGMCAWMRGSRSPERARARVRAMRRLREGRSRLEMAQKL
jgi:hypothetical protein